MVLEILIHYRLYRFSQIDVYKRQQLGYTLPKSLMQKFYIEKLRFYVSGENLFTITGYDGIDPVSYTHLDVYKRQNLHSVMSIR